MQTISRCAGWRRTLSKAIGAAAMAAVLVVGTLGLGGCSDDDSTDDTEDPTFPHTVPAATSMTIDVTDLNEPRLESGAVCHAIAAFLAGWTNLNVAVRIAIPVAVFDAAASNTPVFLGDLTWRWTASGGTGANAWTAALTGHVASEERVEWSMRVSGTPANLQDFLWYDGYSNPVATSGEWRYYDPATPTQQSQLLLCTWTTLASDDRELTFENTIVGTPEEGDILRYGIDGTTASMEFEDASITESTSIYWDTADGSGSASNQQGTCCWGPRPDFDDVACP